MATEFKILRGNKSTLIDENNVVLIPDSKLVNGYWYLTNDTAEVFVCLPDETGELTLKKINECDVNTDFPDMESFEERLTALEADRTHVYGYRKNFPTIGERDHVYIAEDEHRTYIFANNDYIHIADKFDAEDTDNDPETPDVRVIFGGNAN